VVELLFLDAAIEDLEELDGSALRLVLGKIRVLFTDPEAGQPLGRTPTGNLTGFRKLVVGDRAYRVVYRVEDSGAICVVWVVAARADERCYALAVERLRGLGDHPEARRLADMLDQMKPRTQKTIVRIRPDLLT
jgi:mRNA interferase RelE/StbE